MSRELEVTYQDGEFTSADYKALLARLAILLLTDLGKVKRALRLVPVEQPREDGPFYQLQVVGDGETVLFTCEGESEEQLADSLWAAICAKYRMIEAGGLSAAPLDGPLN